MHAPDAAVAPSCCAGRAVDECRLRHVCGRRLAGDIARSAHPGPRPNVVPRCLRRPDRGQPAGSGSGAPPWSRGGAASADGRGRCRPDALRHRRVRMAGLDQRRRRLASPLHPRHRVGAGCAPRLERPCLDACGWRRGHRGAGPLGGVPGQHGRRQWSRSLEPQPAHPRRSDLRHRTSRPGSAAAPAVGQVDAPARRLGRGRDGKPVRDDAVPLASDRVHRRHDGRTCHRPHAWPPDGPG